MCVFHSTNQLAYHFATPKGVGLVVGVAAVMGRGLIAVSAGVVMGVAAVAVEGALWKKNERGRGDTRGWRKIVLRTQRARHRSLPHRRRHKGAV